MKYFKQKPFRYSKHSACGHKSFGQGDRSLKDRQNLKILLLFVLLLNTAAVPVFFTEFHNRYYMDKTVVFSVHADSLEDSAENYDLWERLKILKNAALVQTQSRRNYQVVYYSNGTEATESSTPIPEKTDEQIKNHLIQRAEKQLRKLKKYQTLPEIALSDLQAFSCFKQIYMDMENPAHTLSVWELHMEYPGILVHLYMDIETSALCEVEIFSLDNRGFIYQKGEMSAEGFLEYLNTFSKAPGGDRTDEDEIFHGRGIFYQKYICLYAASSNKNGNRITSYRFDSYF